MMKRFTWWENLHTFSFEFFTLVMMVMIASLFNSLLVLPTKPNL